MVKINRLVVLCVIGFVSLPAFASFHFMQIEKLIVGVGDDLTAQAIQLRMRSGGQSFVSSTRLVAYDAQGANPVVVVNLGQNVSNGASGSRILICTSSFTALTTPAAQPDFLITNPIPAAYRAAGRLTFENDNGTVYWSLSWGGSAYTGSNAGTDNDNNGNFGPPFPEGLPSSPLDADFARRAVLTFQGATGDLSTSNSTDYELEAAAPVFRNNSNFLFTLPLATDGTDLNSVVQATLAVSPAGATDVSADGLWDALDVQLMLAETLGSGAVLGDSVSRGSGVQLRLLDATADQGVVQLPIKLQRDNLTTDTPDTITAGIAYDSSILNFAGLNAGDDLFDWYGKTVEFSEVSPGLVKIIIWGTTFQEITCVDNQRGGENTDEVRNPFTLATLAFTVEAKGGQTDFTIDSFQMAEGSGLPFLAATAENTSVQIGTDTGADINGSGSIDAVDVQLVINAALNIDIGGLDADVNGDSSVNAVDVQLVINAALA